MNQPLWKVYIVELLGTFALVYFSAGVVCVDQMTTLNASPAQAPVAGHQPGLLGIALTQGLILLVIWAITVPISGGFANPAITLTLGIFRTLPMIRVVWLLGAQMVGGIVAGLCLRLTFSEPVLEACHHGMPHLSSLAFPAPLSWRSFSTAMVWELWLTFLLLFAYFRAPIIRDPMTAQESSMTGASLAGMALTAGTLLGYPLSGSVANPVCWIGPALWERLSASTSDPRFALSPGLIVYGIGPLFGSILAALVHFQLLSHSRTEPDASESVKPSENSKKSSRTK